MKGEKRERIEWIPWIAVEFVGEDDGDRVDWGVGVGKIAPEGCGSGEGNTTLSGRVDQNIESQRKKRRKRMNEEKPDIVIWKDFAVEKGVDMQV